MQPLPKNIQPRRRWWQRLVRIGTMVVLLLAAGYVTLPRWVPVALLRGYIERDLARQVGAPVHIQAMDLSWSRGVEIVGLTIDSPSRADAPLLRADAIRLDFSPLELLFRNRIAWMEVERPQLAVRWDADGNNNLAPLGCLFNGPETARISVHRADLVIYPTEAGSAPLHVRVGDVRFKGGAVDEIGQVTVAADLEQRGGNAPVGVNVQGNMGENGVKASATFNFANVKLDQLHLMQLLQLPLKTLSGTCRGSLRLRMSRSGVIDQFALQVDIHNLDVQPVQGPHIPVIEQAGLNMQASIDLIENRLQIQHASVRLPGVELTGGGAMSTEILVGQWRAIDSLHLAGEIYPDQLMALLSGGPVRGEELQCVGPVRIDSLQINQANQVLDLSLTASANAAVLRQDKRIVKPAGRALDFQLAAQLDFRTWMLTLAKGTGMSLGGNRFALSGQVDDLRRVRELLVPPQSASRPAEFPWKNLLAAVSRFEGRGEWKIVDLASLTDLHPALETLLHDANFRGSMRGQWAIDRRTRTRLDAGMVIPPDAVFRAPGVLNKAEDQALSASFACTLDANSGVRDAAMDLSIGPARLSVSSGQLVLEDANTGAVAGHALFEAAGVEELAMCLPTLSPLRGKVRGTVRGEASANISDALGVAGVSVDLKGVGIDWPGVVTKPPGREGEVKVQATLNPRLARNERLQAGLTWKCSEAELSIRVTAGDDIRQILKQGKASGEIHVHDVNWLTGTFPGLNNIAKNTSLTGSVLASAQGQWNDQALDGQLRLNADAVDVIADSPVRIRKTSVPLNLSVEGSLRRQGRDFQADLQSLVMNFADCTARLSGKAVLADESASHPILRSMQMECQTTFNVDRGLGRLLPDVEYWIDRLNLSGQVHGVHHVTLDGNEYRLASVVRADDLAAAARRDVFPGAAAVDSTTAAKQPCLVKPAGLPAAVTLEAIVARDFSRVLMQNFIVTAGELNVLASMLAENRQRGEFADPDNWTASAHLAVAAPNMRGLVKFCPDLQHYAPAGGWLLDAEWKKDANGQRISYASLQMEELRATYNQKDVFLNGDVTLRNIPLPDNLFARDDRAGRLPSASQPASRPAPTWRPLMDGVKIDSLEFRIGKNHAWILADLRELIASPKGEFHVVGEFLDDKDIADWLADANAPRLAAVPMDANMHESIQSRALVVLDVCKRTLSDANVLGRVSVERMRTYDNEVKEYYDVNSLETVIALRRGQASVDAVASLNGGIYSQSACTNFNDADATLITVADIHDVAATKNIQPQIAAYFPGNNVFGTFGRRAKLITPLRDVVANMLDDRYRYVSLGEATTLAINGEVVGQKTPSYATRLFPDLNLSKFHYNRMTGFARNRADGAVENQMIFNGGTYDIYMEGVTTADNVCEYQIGLVLLGGIVSPEVHRDWKQGRVPLLKFKGRIVNGNFADEKISLLWPHESAFEVFVKNNPFYRLWLNAQKK